MLKQHKYLFLSLFGLFLCVIFVIQQLSGPAFSDSHLVTDELTEQVLAENNDNSQPSENLEGVEEFELHKTYQYVVCVVDFTTPVVPGSLPLQHSPVPTPPPWSVA